MSKKRVFCIHYELDVSGLTDEQAEIARYAVDSMLSAIGPAVDRFVAKYSDNPKRFRGDYAKAQRT